MRTLENTCIAILVVSVLIHAVAVYYGYKLAVGNGLLAFFIAFGTFEIPLLSSFVAYKGAVDYLGWAESTVFVVLLLPYAMTLLLILTIVVRDRSLARISSIAKYIITLYKD